MYRFYRDVRRTQGNYLIFFHLKRNQEIFRYLKLAFFIYLSKKEPIDEEFIKPKYIS